MQIAHVKLSGSDNWGGAAQLLAAIEAARQRGVRLDCDQYPYTTATNPLRNLLPTWVQEDGMAAMLERLADPAVRTRLRHDIDAHGLNNFGRIPSWDAVRIAISPHQPQYAGRTMGDMARERGGDPLDAVCDYLIADHGHTRILITCMDEADVQTIIRTPSVLVGSDGTSLAPYGITGQGKPHPRFYGTFPRLLGHYVRDLGLLSLPQAIYKMTGGSAAALGLVDRGLLREGYRADLTIFDPEEVADRATFDDPHQYAAGISTVIVNGVVVIDEGEHGSAAGPGTAPSPGWDTITGAILAHTTRATAGGLVTETFTIVNSQLSMVEALEAVQRAAFPTLAEDEIITAAHYAAHIARFPEGQFAVLNAAGQVVACSTDFRTSAVDFNAFEHRYIDAVATIG